MSGQLIGWVNVVLEMLECAILLCYILIIKKETRKLKEDNEG